MNKILGLLLVCALCVHAETKTWLGGDGAYATPEQWEGSAVPVAGDTVVISNGAVTVTAADSFTGLVSVVLGEAGKIVCGQTVETAASVSFSVSNVLQVSAGELVFHGYASGTGFTKEGPGAVRFTGRDSASAVWAPGLREARLAGSFDLTSPNNGTRVSAALDMANTVWPAAFTNTTFVYTGEIYLDGSEYLFAESVDDNVYLAIGGSTVLSNQSSTTVSQGSVQQTAGWYPIELRLGNSLGAGGSLNAYSTGGGIAWKKGIAAWQVLRDFNGGAFLRSPGTLAVNFSEGILLATGTVAVSAGTASGSTNAVGGNTLGGVTLNGGTLALSNTACRATSFNGASNTLLRLDFAGLTLTNDTDSFHYGTTAGVGTWTKDGSGKLQWQARSASHYAHAATVVNQGIVALGSSASWLGDYSFGTFTVTQPGMVDTLINGNTQFASLWGDGGVTNSSSGAPNNQLRIVEGPCEFTGRISGSIRYYSRGVVALTGTNSTFGGNFAINSIGGPGVTGLKKIGLNGQPSSMGTSGSIDIREGGGTLLYLGTGETTDKIFSLYPSSNRAVIDGGQNGGVTFNGTWAASGGRLVRVAVTGTNAAAPCVLNGAYTEHSLNGTNYSTYIAKEGTGTWVFKSNAGRANRGVVDVRNGTLQFESLAEAGTVCSLGRSDLLFSDTISSVTNGLDVPYAFSLGTATTVGTLEYIGTNAVTCGTRKLVLQGNGRLKSDAAPLAFNGGVQALTAGSKTLFLAGSGTNVMGTVVDGAGTVGITKEGSGTWRFSATNAFSGPLSVQAGELVLDKRGYSYYRFNLLQRNFGVPGGDSNIELAEFALYSADGVRRNLNLVKNGTNNVAGLNPGEFCPMGSYFTYLNRNDINLFDANANSQWTTDTGAFLPATPMRLVMRLADGTPPITGYDLQYWSAASNRFLSGWSLEGSRDGAVWFNLHSVTNYAPIPPAIIGGVKWWYSTGTVTPSNGFAVADGQLTEAQLKAGVQVSVSSGARLIFLGGTEALSALSVDLDAGGGTISGLELAQNGRLDLTGSQVQGRNFALPLTVSGITNPEYLRGWSLYINGQLVRDAALRWDAATETIRVCALGTVIAIF